MSHNNCLHCNEAIVMPDADFCCLGCNTAYKLIHALKLDKYYEYCQSIYGQSPQKIMELENQLDYREYVAKGSDGTYRISLLIHGVHCGACIYLIENTLKKQNGVVNARLNLSTKKIVIDWLDEAVDINALIRLIEKLGYTAVPFVAEDMLKESEKLEKNLLKRLAVAGAASAQVMMILFGVWVGNMNGSIGPYMKLILHIIAGMIAIPSILYAGMPFFTSALIAIRNKRSNMDVPISIGVIATTFISIQETIRSADYAYYDAAIGLLFVLLIGRYLDIKARNKATARVREIVMSRPVSITIIFEDKRYRVVDIRKAKVGQIAFVATGEIIAADGIIVSGISEVDNSVITGETLPIQVKEGDNVYAGSINLGAPLKIQIVALTENSVINEIMRLIESASQARSKYVTLAEKISSYYTIVVFSAAAITFLYWHFAALISIPQALLYSVAVLIITCPCALGLAVPIVQIIAVLKLIRSGILVKSPDALEKISKVTDIIFDKTGTLTYGKPLWLNKDQLPKQIIKIIYSMALHSKHPLMESIIRACDKNIKPLKIAVIEELGMGLHAKYRNKSLLLGNRQWCDIDKELNQDDYLETWLKIDNKQYRLIFIDILRREMQEIAESLQSEGFNLHILSGDRPHIVNNIADQLGINSYIGGLKPVDKYNKINDMRQDGKIVLMVGDGINDAPSLKLADVSISPSNAIGIALNNADIVFQKDFYSLIEIIKIAKFYIVLIKQNFLLSFIYNIISVPIAMFGFVTPLIAALVMSVSSLTVVGNAMRLNFNDKKSNVKIRYKS